MNGMKWHPDANIFPMLSDDELQQLANDIKANGLNRPVVMFEGMVLDGRNRWTACQLAGVKPETTEFKGTKEQALAFVVSENVKRRHMNPTQLALVGDTIRGRFDELAKERQGKRTDLVENLPQGRGVKGVETLPHLNGKARDQVGEVVGVSGKQIDKARKVRESGRQDLIEKCTSGEMSLHQATTELKRDAKREELKQKAKQAKAAFQGQPNWTLIASDVMAGLESVRDHHGPARLIFTDPPHNIGINYGSHHNDNMPDDVFVEWCFKWMQLCCECLTDDGSMWVMINDEYAAQFATQLRRCGLVMRSWIKWYETFGVNCSNNFNRTSRHIFYFVMDPAAFIFNETEVLRPSDRQIKYNDSRAQGSGKILDDVWQIPRLTGTSKERIPDFPTQLPVELVDRIVRVASEPGDLIVDPFNGSGTTGVCAIQNNRKYIGVDASEKFIDLAEMRLRSCQ